MPSPVFRYASASKYRREETNLEIYDVIWKDRFVDKDKLAVKHGVSVEEVVFGSAHLRRVERGPGGGR